MGKEAQLYLSQILRSTERGQGGNEVGVSHLSWLLESWNKLQRESQLGGSCTDESQTFVRPSLSSSSLLM